MGSDVVNTYRVRIVVALHLVMARLRNGPRRTTLNTRGTCPPIKKAVGMMVHIGSGRGGNLDMGHHGPAPDRLPLGSDQAVTKAKGSQAGGIGRMPFRPGGSTIIFHGALDRGFLLIKRRDKRSDRLASRFLQTGHHMLAKFSVDFLAILASSGPSFRGIASLFPVIGLRRLGLR